jgi:hypothetical protein
MYIQCTTVCKVDNGDNDMILYFINENEKGWLKKGYSANGPSVFNLAIMADNGYTHCAVYPKSGYWREISNGKLESVVKQLMEDKKYFLKIDLIRQYESDLKKVYFGRSYDMSGYTAPITYRAITTAWINGYDYVSINKESITCYTTCLETISYFDVLKGLLTSKIISERKTQ